MTARPWYVRRTWSWRFYLGKYCIIVRRSLRYEPYVDHDYRQLFDIGPIVVTRKIHWQYV